MDVPTTGGWRNEWFRFTINHIFYNTTDRDSDTNSLRQLIRSSTQSKPTARSVNDSWFSRQSSRLTQQTVASGPWRAESPGFYPRSSPLLCIGKFHRYQRPCFDYTFFLLHQTCFFRGFFRVIAMKTLYYDKWSPKPKLLLVYQPRKLLLQQVYQ